jgi:DNA-binding LytR/AlgR family response regulator
MQDHYVEIVTEAGAHLVLLRLSDAMAEAAPTPGLQVHRSHWVAERAVAGAKREDGRLRLVLVDGTEIPVSRGRARAVREAGWA